MLGQSSPVQVKDPYTGSILMHVGSSCKHTGVYNVCTPPKNNQKLIDGSNKKTKKKNTRIVHTYQHVQESLRFKLTQKAFNYSIA